MAAQQSRWRCRRRLRDCDGGEGLTAATAAEEAEEAAEELEAVVEAAMVAEAAATAAEAAEAEAAAEAADTKAAAPATATELSASAAAAAAEWRRLGRLMRQQLPVAQSVCVCCRHCCSTTATLHPHSDRDRHTLPPSTIIPLRPQAPPAP